MCDGMVSYTTYLVALHICTVPQLPNRSSAVRPDLGHDWIERRDDALHHMSSAVPGNEGAREVAAAAVFEPCLAQSIDCWFTRLWYADSIPRSPDKPK